MKNHIKEYMIHYTQLNNYIDFFNVDGIFTFDTESCFTSNKIKEMYETKQVVPHQEDAVKIYAWALSNTVNDYVLYGETLDQFFKSIETIINSRLNFDQKMTKNKVKDLKTKSRIRIFVHNLGWDIEFCKYYLLRNGYSYYNSCVKDGKKINKKSDEMTFNIIEKDNNVYSANINLKGRKVSYRQKIQKEFYMVNETIFPVLDFVDSYKIMALKLETIGKKVIKIDDKFNKLGADYDYDTVRKDGHILTEFEKMYLYNDVYILKEFIKQFYEPINTTKTTASSISFEKFLEGKYGYDKPYKQFLEDYPDLYKYKNIQKIIKESYKGGWTQANKYYVGKHLKGINGTSIDINSSYPAVIRYKPLPYGLPMYYEGYHKCNNDELSILTIEFDCFYNKHENNFIGEIQCGSINKEIFKTIATEYLHTNIVDGEVKGTNGKSINRRYRLYIWEFELENILENTVFENYDVIETLTFKSNVGHFGEVVDHYTELKINSKKDGNNAMTNFAKLTLNSFYGKLASSPERIERKIVLKNGLVQNENTDVFYESSQKFYPSFSSCVTAWARVNLRTQLYKLCIDDDGNFHNNILYFDTDSLYTTLPVEEVREKLGTYASYNEDGTIKEILDENGILDPYYLGKWDIEKTYCEFKSIGSKKYMVKCFNGDVLRKCAGLPEEVRNNIEFEEFELGNTFTGKKMKTKVKGGYALLEGDYTLNNNVFRG